LTQAHTFLGFRYFRSFNKIPYGLLWLLGLYGLRWLGGGGVPTPMLQVFLDDLLSVALRLLSGLCVAEEAVEST
jgi:hypothetical protein